MFTGIVEALGTITNHVQKSDGLAISVALPSSCSENPAIGDSVSVNGICLTVTSIDQSIARFDVSSETINKCLIGEWQVNKRVNLERALTLQTPIGGHLVSGHVDGIGTLLQRKDEKDSSWMQFSTSRDIGRFIAMKGSVAIDGVSLTSNQVFDEVAKTIFEVAIIPHTLKVTTLGNLMANDSVHLEIDLIARYLQRMTESDNVSS